MTDRLRVLEEQVAALTAQVDRLMAVAQAVQVTGAVIESLYRDAYARGEASTRPAVRAARPRDAGARSRARLSVVGEDRTPGGAA